MAGTHNAVRSDNDSVELRLVEAHIYELLAG
jgi:hypothetical protein